MSEAIKSTSEVSSVNMTSCAQQETASVLVALSETTAQATPSSGVSYTALCEAMAMIATDLSETMTQLNMNSVVNADAQAKLAQSMVQVTSQLNEAASKQLDKMAKKSLRNKIFGDILTAFSVITFIGSVCTGNFALAALVGTMGVLSKTGATESFTSTLTNALVNHTNLSEKDAKIVADVITCASLAILGVGAGGIGSSLQGVKLSLSQAVVSAIFGLNSGMNETQISSDIVDAIPFESSTAKEIVQGILIATSAVRNIGVHMGAFKTFGHGGKELNLNQTVYKCLDLAKTLTEVGTIGVELGLGLNETSQGLIRMENANNQAAAILTRGTSDSANSNVKAASSAALQFAEAGNAILKELDASNFLFEARA
ncbi:MAG: hypothetical protein JSS61_05425 [Verrucomicrobia bacterium]|nr:hypothetical protein [Verrucomicrobiota bacterium]